MLIVKKPKNKAAAGRLQEIGEETEVHCGHVLDYIYRMLLGPYLESQRVRSHGLFRGGIR